jgi:hypothetical protein
MPSGQAVHRRAADLLGGEDRWNLGDGAAECLHDALQGLHVDVHLTRGAAGGAGAIVGVGADPETQAPTVGLVHTGEEWGEPGRLPDHQDEKPGGQGIQRPGVPDPTDAEDAPSQGHHVV